MSAARTTPMPTISADDHPEAVRVVADERLVDDAASREPDERDLRRLRADGEEDRDEEADAVGAKEAEQADERRSVRNGTHFFNLALGSRLTA